MYNVLCYGDSNTWGFVHEIGSRYSINERWTGVLKNLLGEEYNVIEEGLNGRTTVFDDPICDHRNGKSYLLPCLRSHMPIDLVIIMLGTNDLKTRFSSSPYEISRGLGTLIDIIESSKTGRKQKSPNILVVAPPVIKNIKTYIFEETFKDGVEKSKKLIEYYKLISKEYGTFFLDSSDIIETSPIDGVHLDKNSHRILGEKIYNVVREIS